MSNNSRTIRPNILCFLTDQHRADHLGCYGNRVVRTPSIDRLAEQGLRFTESFVANPVCMPNRACWFTGQYPSAHGLTENGYTLPPSATVMPELLRQAGYQTASFGKIHLAPSGMNRHYAKHEWELYEGWEYWEQHREAPKPYYGLEHVKLVNSCGFKASQSYLWWLRDNHPEALPLLHPKAALEPPSGARESWKASLPEELHYNTWIADNTIDYLRTRDSSKPFFIWCSFPDPHHPYSPSRPWCDMYDPRDIVLAPTRRDGELDDLPWFFRASYEGKLRTGGLGANPSSITDDHYREIIAHTYGMISMIDANIGRVMSEMEAQGLLDNTIILFMTDHGDLMGDHWLINKGPYLFRGLVRVPTIWRVPDGVSGSASDEMVSAVDVCPTLLELAGIGVPDCVQGRSYAGLLTGRKGGERNEVYIEYDESYIPDRLRQVRTRDWAITYCTHSRTGTLFDLKNDPGELYNLWDCNDHQSVKRDLMYGLLQTAAWAAGPPPPKPIHA